MAPTGMEMPDDANRCDPVVAAYLRDVDRTLLRENLKLSHEQRAAKHRRVLEMAEELRRAGNAMRRSAPAR